MEYAPILVALGVLFLSALVLDAVGRRTHIPRVTLLIVLGAVLGPPVLDVLPPALSGTNDSYAAVALTMVAFLLGGSLGRKTLARHGRTILVLSLSVVAVSILAMAVGLVAFGVPVELALILAGISAATAPAATRDVIHQSGQAGPFATMILGVVAIDDVWGILVFSLLLTISGTLIGSDAGSAMWLGLHEAGGAALLGLAIGIPAAYLTGRLKPGEPTLLEALGVVLLCAGFALSLEVSFLITGITCGAVIVNLARHHDQPFHEIEQIEWPFILLFFVMAGASLEIESLKQIGLIGLAYIVLRFIARVIGGLVGGRLVGFSTQRGVLTGLALMPQAGVAIGMALVAADRFPSYADRILAITISSTIVFEVIGPLLTLYAMGAVKRLDQREAAASGYAED